MIDLISLVSSFVLGIIVWFIYEVYIWPYYVSPLRKLPGPPSKNPIYDGLFAEEEELLPSTWIKKYGSVMKYHGFLNRPTVIIADPKIIHETAVNQARDFVKPNRGNTLAVIGNGIVLAEGEDHKRQRKMMNPAFAYINIKEMVPVFTRVALKLKGLLEDKVNAGESNVNLTSIVSKTTLDIIGLVGFNYEINSLTSSSELAEAYIVITNRELTKSQIILNSISDNIPSVRKLPIDQYKKFNRACEVIDRVSSQLVKEKYREDKDNKLNGKDLLSLLINTNKTLPVEEKMTDDELKYQIMTFTLAGHETTSNSTSWALYLLAKHPHEQDLLREELVKAFPDKSKFNPTLDDINSLEYLNCVVKETLRLYSPVTNISRVSTKDNFFGEHFIPKNTLILFSILSLHRSPSIWGPTADDFDPKRWLNAKDISSLNYLPFYTGPRNCIGSKLALAEFKLLLCMLIRNFVFKPVEGFHIRKRTCPIAKLVPYLNLTVSKVEA